MVFFERGQIPKTEFSVFRGILAAFQIILEEVTSPDFSLRCDSQAVQSGSAEKKTLGIFLSELQDRDCPCGPVMGNKGLPQFPHLVFQARQGFLIPGVSGGQRQVDVLDTYVQHKVYGIVQTGDGSGGKNTVCLQRNTGHSEKLPEVGQDSVKTALVFLGFLGQAVKAELDPKSVPVQKPEDFVREQASVGGDGEGGIFAVFLVLAFKPGNGSLYQVKGQERLPAVKNKAVICGQEG
jgi:hypothetical protein